MQALVPWALLGENMRLKTLVIRLTLEIGSIPPYCPLFIHHPRTLSEPTVFSTSWHPLNPSSRLQRHLGFRRRKLTSGLGISHRSLTCEFGVRHLFSYLADKVFSASFILVSKKVCRGEGGLVSRPSSQDGCGK